MNLEDLRDLPWERRQSLIGLRRPHLLGQLRQLRRDRRPRLEQDGLLRVAAVSSSREPQAVLVPGELVADLVVVVRVGYVHPEPRYSRVRADRLQQLLEDLAPGPAGIPLVLVVAAELLQAPILPDAFIICLRC